VKDHIEDILIKNAAVDKNVIAQLQIFNGDDYFRLLEEINDFFIKKKYPRLSALLQNLIERKNNKWQKHLSAAEGPKKLKEIQ
jgi:hypothetical protein